MFTHVDAKNNPKMVDVSEKLITERQAKAYAEVELPPEVLAAFKDGDIHSKKGPVFHTAIIAGTQAMKKTSELIPFCHQINLEKASLEINLEGNKVIIRSMVKCVGKTGVEMEALAGVSVAGLTIYDMCKAFSQNIIIKDIHLRQKSGGKTSYLNQDEER